VWRYRLFVCQSSSSTPSLFRSPFSPLLAVIAAIVACVLTSPSSLHATPRTPMPGACDTSKPSQHFVVDMTGSFTSSGHIYEGPLCVEVYYNPAVQFVLLESAAGTPVAMPDFAKILLGGPAAAGDVKKNFMFLGNSTPKQNHNSGAMYPLPVRSNPERTWTITIHKMTRQCHSLRSRIRPLASPSSPPVRRVGHAVSKLYPGILESRQDSA
jgi:hypothetical protein